MPIPAISHYLEPFVNIGNCSNLGLASDKLVLKVDEQNEHDCKDRAVFQRNGFALRDDGLEAYKLAFSRREKCMSKYCDAVLVEIKSTTPVILGSGNPNIHEAGLNLLRPWGVPFIHGSTLKGALSAYLAKHGGTQWKCDEEGKSDLQLQLFGGAKVSDSYIGNVCFTDAWIQPRPDAWFKSDIITPHHKLYYSGTQQHFPDGMENPVPINVSVLKLDLIFQFYLVGPENERNFLKTTLACLLKEEGIGAKTAVGYGRFELVASEEDHRNQILNADEEELVELGENKTLLDNFEGSFSERVQSLSYSEKTRRLLIRFCPARVILHDLKEKKPKTNKEARDIRNNIDRNFSGEKVDPANPEVRKIFDYCLQNGLKKGPEENDWLDAFAYGWESMNLETTTDDQHLEIIEKISEGGWSWPPVEEYRKWLTDNRPDLMELFE